MNKIFLIGNGFDLAHGLKTDYNTFLIGYLISCLEKAFYVAGQIFEDELISVQTKSPGQSLLFINSVEGQINGIPDLVNFVINMT